MPPVQPSPGGETHADYRHSAGHPHIGRRTVTAPAGSPARKPGQSNRPHKTALVMVGLGVASRIARDARTQEAVILVAIMVAVAVAGVRASEAKSVARLAAWDKKQAAKAMHKVKSATKATVQAIQPGTD